MGNKKGLVCLFASFVLFLASCSNGMLDFASGKKSSGDSSTVKSEKALLSVGSAVVVRTSDMNAKSDDFRNAASRTLFASTDAENLTGVVLTGKLTGASSDERG